MRKTFYMVCSWNMYVTPKRFARPEWAYEQARKMREENPGKKFYVTKSLGRFSDEGYTQW